MPGATLSNDDLGVGFAVNGGRTQSANYLLDGAEDNEIMMSAPAVDVPLDSVQEFNVQTNHFSAEYGLDSVFIAALLRLAEIFPAVWLRDSEVEQEFQGHTTTATRWQVLRWRHRGGNRHAHRPDRLSLPHY